MAAKYDLGWLIENEMGPSSVWLTESLVGEMDLKPGMRVLDLGCGKAVSSIFLAKEFGVQVFANDLWISPTENWERVKKAGVEDSVFPIYAKARLLPYADGFFDAVVSVNSYHYFGTDEMFLPSFIRYLKPGGQLGIVVPGVHKEFEGVVPEAIKPYWEPQFFTYHSPAWWKAHFEKAGISEVLLADTMPNGYELWLKWDKTLQEAGVLKRPGDVELLMADGGNLTWTRLVAAKTTYNN